MKMGICGHSPLPSKDKSHTKKHSNKTNKKDITEVPIHVNNKDVSVGDKVLLKVQKVDNDTFEGRVLHSMTRANRSKKSRSGQSDETPLICLIKHGRAYPVDRRNRRDYELHNNKDINDGMVVQGKADGNILFIDKILCDAPPLKSISLISAGEFNLPMTFSEDALKIAESAKAVDLKGREDVRKLPLVTIDGADAKDFDDAVYAEQDGQGGYKIIVAIADVAHYVPHNSALDKEARQRGNSTYFPDMVIPMLPEVLSNGWCSLNPDVERACHLAHMNIDEQGNLRKLDFTRGVMKSHARLTYEQIEKDKDNKKYKDLYGCFNVLLKNREARQALEINSKELYIDFDKNMTKIQQLRARESLNSHKLIEEFMILTNVASASYLEQQKKPCMYRIHDLPKAEKIDALREILKSTPLKVPQNQVLSTAQFNKYLTATDDEIIHEAILRCQSQAVYSHKNIGHYGLALAKYAHFTSPIRRYADLVNHRMIIGEIDTFPEDLGTQLSETERNAAKAEYASKDRFIALFFEDKVGTTFDARISTITKSGIFIKLRDTLAEGFMPLSNFGNSRGQERWHFNPKNQTLKGRKSKKLVSVGDTLRVTLVECNGITGSMIFRC